MYYCNGCGHSFEEPKEVCCDHEEECLICEEFFDICPYCNSADIKLLRED